MTRKTEKRKRQKERKDKKKGKAKRQKEKTQVEEPNPRAKLISTQAASLSNKFRSLKQNELLKLKSFLIFNSKSICCKITQISQFSQRS